MNDSSPERPLKTEVNKIETDIPMDTAESCRRKYNSLREAQKLHKLNDINYRIEILKKLLYLWDKYAPEIALSNRLDLGLSESNNILTNQCLVEMKLNLQ